MDTTEELWEAGIMAILPVYLKDQGNCTLVITEKKGTKHLYNRLKTVMLSLGQYLVIDMKSLKKQCGHLLGASNVIPIPLGKEDIFIPIKMRRPISKNDGAFGYFNHRYIEEVIHTKDGNYILLKGYGKIKICQSYRTAKEHVQQGEIVKKLFKDKPLLHEAKHAVEGYQTDYKRQATKADIALLYQEIIRLKEELVKNLGKR